MQMTDVKIFTNPENAIFEVSAFDVENNPIHLLSDYNGWYQLKLHNASDKFEILDIQINGCSIEHVIYTGFAVNIVGQFLQPCLSVWKEVEFCIWLHTDLGILLNSIYSQIRNGDYGTNLFEKYSLTVDKPLILDSKYPESVKKFFAKSAGPHWWHKDNADFPYTVVPVASNREMIESLDLLEQHMRTSTFYNQPYRITIKGKNGQWRQLDTPTWTKWSDPMPLDCMPINKIKEFLYNIGYRKIISYGILELDPYSYIDVHIDDHPDGKNLKYITGAKKLYMSYNTQENVYFKLGNAGMLPLGEPLLINTVKHVHSVVNNSDKLRKVFMLYGVLKQDIEITGDKQQH
jgi:hypothetical protein